MNVREIAESLDLEVLTPEVELSPKTDVESAYVTDLLSDVLGHAPRGGLLITIQIHMNVIAVALHAELSGVIFASGRRPDEAVRRKAIEEGIPLFVTDRSAFDIAGRLYELGLRGNRE